jgi:hypothetical protein
LCVEICQIRARVSLRAANAMEWELCCAADGNGAATTIIAASCRATVGNWGDRRTVHVSIRCMMAMGLRAVAFGRQNNSCGKSADPAPAG